MTLQGWVRRKHAYEEQAERAAAMVVAATRTRDTARRDQDHAVAQVAEEVWERSAKRLERLMCLRTVAARQLVILGQTLPSRSASSRARL
jgi:hypothetical protein